MKPKLTLLLLLLLSFSVFSQTNRVYKIGILIDQSSAELAPLLEKLKSEIIAVVGEDAEIQFPDGHILINNFDVQQAKRNYETLLSNDTDIILAFGVVNNQIISPLTVHQKPTILFGAVNRDVHTLDLSSLTSGIDNFTFLVESESFKEDFKKFQELTNFKNLGIVVDAPFVEILPLEETFDRELTKLGSKLQVDSVQNNSGYHFKSARN